MKQQRQRAAEAAGRGGSDSSNKMQLVREKIDDVVVRAPAPAKATVGHTHTYKHFATLSHTHAHLCAPWTQKSFASLKSLALSLLLLSPAPTRSLSCSTHWFSSMAFIFDVSSPHLNHLSPSILLVWLLLLQAYRLAHAHTHAHILSLCACVFVCGGSVTIWRISDIGLECG